MNRLRWVLLLAAAVVPCGAAAQTPVPAPATSVPGVRWSAADSIPRLDYIRRHAVSFDNFLEMQPGGVLVRGGPIGYDAAWSRWGIGRGRARLTLNGIPLNDPQDGVAPYARLATSGFGALVSGDAALFDATLPDGPVLEGDLRLSEEAPPLAGPGTFVELSNGHNDLRQRRVRFMSQDADAGLDLSYDEVLDDGYEFDGTGTIGDAPNFGKARTRQGGVVLRGKDDAGARYAFGLRRFVTTLTGTLEDPAEEGTRDGHLAWVDVSHRGARAMAYGRGYKTERPDSQTVSETAGGALSWASPADNAAGVAFSGRIEHTRARMDVSADTVIADTTVTVLGGSLTALGRWRLVRGANLVATGSWLNDDAGDPAWAGGVALTARRSAHGITLSGQRSARLPNLAERFLPAHTRDGRTLTGDGAVGSESALELGAAWDMRTRVFSHRLRASWIESSDAVLFLPRSVGSETWRVATNVEESSSMVFVEEWARAVFQLGPIRSRVEGSFLFTDGDRRDAFRSVPETMATASVRFGGDMFEATSGLSAGAEFVYMDTRRDYDGTILPEFGVLNLLVEARLLSARFYLAYLNVMDEQYATLGNHLMTPRSFVYGIEWTLFN